MTDTTARGMTADDLYRITYAGDAQISPDGTRVAYVQTRMDKEKDEYLSNIWVVPTAGGAPVQFTSGARRDTSPRWSPDGRWLAFLSNRASESKQKDAKDEKDQKNQIWVMPTDGGEARKLTSLKSGAGSIAWSPDSGRIAFTSRVSVGDDRDDDEADKDSQGGKNGGGEAKAKKTARARVITTLKYKLNGEGFTYDRRPHIFVVSVDASGSSDSSASKEGSEPRQITEGDFNDQAPTWSPDGKLIAFTSARHDERDFNGVSDIFVVSADGGEPRQVTQGRGPSHDASFSPDGKTLAYLGHTDPHAGGARNTNLWTVPLSGGEAKNLSGGLDRTASGDRAPVWSADGSTIYFGISDWGTGGVRAVAAGGGEIRTVVGGQRVVGSWSLSGDRSALAFSASDPTNPGDVFTIKSDGSGERRLTDVNAAWKREVTLSAPEEFTYTSVDGWTVEGWVMKPAAYEEGRSYPLLLNVHGGPHANYGWGFFDEFQVQAGAGYAVLFTNPRGSQSYGEQFAHACVRDWGGKDFQDIMNGLDYALDQYPFIDRERTGVLGGSYGGFMTSWTVGHTDRFKAAISERAVNALYSMYGSSDIGFHFNFFEVGGSPQESLDFYIERSPVTYAPKMRTPLLIMHSENDLRCPIEQGEQLYVTLKVLRQTDVVFVRFPEESHELSRSGKPSRRVERFQIILDWFDRYLRPGASEPRVEKLAVAAGAL